MPANRNQVSAVSEDGLDLVAVLKDELRGLKEETYGRGCNAYREDAMSQIEKIPRSVSRHDLEGRLDEIFSLAVDLNFAKESSETRAMVEDGLGRQVEKLMPVWFPPRALVMYSLRVEGRNKKEMRGCNDAKNGQWGYKQEQTPVAVLQAKDWPSAWRDFVVFDRMADSGSIEGYMPSDADYLLSTVHKFEVVVRRENRKKVNRPFRNSLDEKYRRANDAESLHWRVKSGPEKLWKMVFLMTGLEKRPGETTEEIVDDAGIRLLCSDGQLGRKFGVVCTELNRGHSLPDLVGSVILQKLPVEDSGYDHLKTFLSSVPKRYKGFCRSIVKEEDRDLMIADKSILPYYVEMLSRFGTNNNRVFDRNIVNTLLYGNSTFHAMYKESGLDQFAYKARNEGWRADHYTLFEWLVAKRLARILMAGSSLAYANDVIETRLSQSSLL